MIGNSVLPSGKELINSVPVPSKFRDSLSWVSSFSSKIDCDFDEYAFDRLTFDDSKYINHSVQMMKWSAHKCVFPDFYNVSPSAHILKIKRGSAQGSGFHRTECISLQDAVEAANKIALWDKSGNERLASFFAVYFIERSHKYYAFEAINGLLSRADVKVLSAWALVALLRSSFPARKFLPAWAPLLDSVRDKLEDSGENSAKILRGLKA